MTRDEVIAMAREAGFKHNAFSQACVKHSSGAWVDVAEELEHFAALMAAAEREAIAAHYAAHPHVEFFGRELADEIRSRSTP